MWADLKGELAFVEQNSDLIIPAGPVCVLLLLCVQYHVSHLIYVIIQAS